LAKPHDGISTLNVSKARKTLSSIAELIVIPGIVGDYTLSALQVTNFVEPWIYFAYRNTADSVNECKSDVRLWVCMQERHFTRE
jgi:hypothetical protein